MDKFTPYEKLSKKEKKKRNARKRGSWGAISPVTRRGKNPRAYNRRKAQQPLDDGGLCLSRCVGAYLSR